MCLFFCVFIKETEIEAFIRRALSSQQRGRALLKPPNTKHQPHAASSTPAPDLAAERLSRAECPGLHLAACGMQPHPRPSVQPCSSQPPACSPPRDADISSFTPASPGKARRGISTAPGGLELGSCGGCLRNAPVGKWGFSWPYCQAKVGSTISLCLCKAKRPGTVHPLAFLPQLPHKGKKAARAAAGAAWGRWGSAPAQNGAGRDGGGGAAERAADLLNYDFNAVALITCWSSNHQMQFMAKQAPKHFSFYED